METVSPFFISICVDLGPGSKGEGGGPIHPPRRPVRRMAKLPTFLNSNCKFAIRPGEPPSGTLQRVQDNAGSPMNEFIC